LQATIAGTNFWQLRDINTGDGFGGRSLIAHFGLGDATQAEVVRIEWPSGISQEIHSVAANQVLTVTEPVHLETLGAGRFHFRAWAHQTFSVESSTNLAVWSAVATVSAQTLSNLTAVVEFRDLDEARKPSAFYRVQNEQ
jgi:hypothetical protein